MSDVQEIYIVKRNGNKEKLAIEKIHKVLTWAAEDLDVSVSQVEMKSNIQFYTGMTSKDIHETLIKTAADQISEWTPDYQYMAARLKAFNLRKIAYGEFTPPTFLSHVKNLVEKKVYDKYITDNYTDEELEIIGTFIDHNRDFNMAYVGIEQMASKYLIQDRVTKTPYETPQMAFILIPVVLFAKYPAETRLEYIKKYYDALSTFKISLPTPIMGGVRSPTRQFSSCVLISAGDSLDSINASSNSIVNYISRRAGIGLNIGKIRALGSPIRNGEAVHTGVIPFIKLFQSAVKSCSQGKMCCPLY